MTELTRRATVLIPAFNEAEHIEAAIRSAVGAGRSDVDVLVIDDHSTDGTAETASHIDGVRVATCRGKGLADALNTGLAEATTDVVIFLDADDRLLDSSVDVLLAECERHPDADLVVGRTRYVDEAGTTLGFQGPLHTVDHHRVAAIAVNTLTHSGSAVRRQTLIDLGGYRVEDSVEGALDFDMWSRAFEAGISIRTVHDEVIRYTVRKSSMTATGRESQVDRAWKIRRRNYDRWASDHLRYRRLVQLAKDERVDGQPAAYDLFVFSLCRLVVIALRRGDVRRSVEIVAALIRLGPVRSAMSAARKISSLRRRRRARGW